MKKFRPPGRLQGLALVLVFLMGATACGDDAEPNETAEKTEDETAEETEDETAEETEAAGTDTETEAEAEDLGEATIMLGGKVITFAPLWVGICEGFYQDHGLEVTITPSESGVAPVNAAIVNREILAAMSGTDIAAAIREDAPIRLSLVISEGYGVQAIVSNEWMEEKGVSQDDPLEDRVAAMQGATYGILTPGDSVDGLMRAVLPRYGMDPDTDITMTAMTNYSNMFAGIQQGVIDAFGGSPPIGPQAESEGLGRILFSGNEFEGLDSMPYLVGAFNTNAMEEEPERHIAFLRGVADAMDLLRSDPDAGRDCLREEFPDLDDATFEGAYDFAMSTLPDSPAITEAQWAAVEDFYERRGDPIGVSFEDGIATDINDEALSGR